MTLTRRAALRAALALPALASAARAQGFPTRPVRVVVPIAPGGANDIIARMVSEKLPAILGQPVVVENRPGAGGNIGADAVAKAEKDGHTLLFTSANVLTANKWLYGRRMPFEALRDLTPVSRVGTGTILIVCNSARPWKSFAELVAFAKANPGRISMGSSGTGTISHLYMEKVKRAAGIDITHIPYRGGGPAITDLVAGTIDIMFDVIPALLPHIREGRFRPLAAGSAQRIDYVSDLAQVPGMAELLPGSGIDALNWWCVVAPAGVPAPVLAQLNGAIRQAVEQEEVRRRLLDLTVKPTTDATPEAFGAFWQAQMPVWQALVEESGATAE
ncbi:Bug family tripartite tricarboxylate transporter substrate binding protein [Paracraurococcus ruber]|uniref:Transporter n=1 Tax=Paracraurococcus ruber TaxID=77675 RepID=A0ABS1D3X7_9PROT|nr:tripartite tricarboxylate transporter substrate binding protein [Paracraurococcus ruber]MBK1660967.1 transporter [Paracraurococcus ruber]TDG28584.1 tripartite tricarboxylate transporter substrate binding protein [Paracraurococcus ruber]